MSHWFDGFVKRAASGGVSRREVLTAGVVSGLGIATRGLGAGGAVVAGSEALAQPAPPRKPLPSVFSTFEPVVVSRDGITVKHELSYDIALSASVMALTITRGTTLIAKVNANVRKELQTVQIEYGPDVHGMKNAMLTARDFQNFSGTIDGRAFTTGGPVASLAGAMFADGKPAPQVNVAQTIPTSLLQISKDLQVALKSRKQIVVPGVAPLQLPADPVADVIGQRIAKPGGNWITPRSRNIPACDRCYDTCADKDGDCTGDIDDWENLLCPPCYALRIAACLFKWGICMAGCNIPGGGCCPVPCGSITDNCCGPDTVCMQPKQRTCCPTDRALCGGFCCEKGTTTCAPDGFCGCPDNQTACGDFCCSPGDICNGGQCYKPSECTGNTCCHAPSHFCNGVCCPPFNGCCGGVCCSSTGACVNGQCCAAANRCGPACCASGQACLDPVAGICGTPPACTPIVKIVPTKGGLKQVSIPRFPCRTLTADRRFVNVCCESGVDCCLGACCSLGRVCCIVNGVAGCNFASSCGPH